jgi:hypothetical protein
LASKKLSVSPITIYNNNRFGFSDIPHPRQEIAEVEGQGFI